MSGELALATRAQRLKAAIIDVALFLVPNLMMQRPGGNLFFGLLGFALFVALVVYQVRLLLRSGQTIGKRALGIRIVCVRTEDRPGFVRIVLLRSFVNSLLFRIPLYWIADCLLIFRPDQRCIHDWLARTKVVQAKPLEGPEALAEKA